MWKDLFERAKEYARTAILDRLKQWFVTPDDVQAVNDDPFPDKKHKCEDDDVPQ